MRKYILLLLIIIILSCNKKKENEPNINNVSNILIELSEKHEIKFLFDTIEDKQYTIDYKDLVNSNSQAIETYEILDIYELKDKKFVKLRSILSSIDYFFNLEVTELELKKLLNNNSEFGFFDNPIVVLKTDSVKKIDFNLEVDPEFGDVILTTPAFGQFLITGKIIECK